MTPKTTTDAASGPEPHGFLTLSGECLRALQKLEQVVVGGLKHGHFECTVIGDIVNGGKRRLIIKAGVSHQFIIPVAEIAHPT